MAFIRSATQILECKIIMKKEKKGITNADLSLMEDLSRFIGSIDPDHKRDGLQYTPNRWRKSLVEMTEGYNQSPAEILSTTFQANYDEMVIVKNIEFSSLCEHHLLPFFGHVSIGYLPGYRKQVVGLSKLPRLVECFSKRLQIQERLTKEIAEAIKTNLRAEGVGVVVTARHCCMMIRGVKNQSSETVTSVLLGRFRSDEKARNEFLNFIK